MSETINKLSISDIILIEKKLAKYVLEKFLKLLEWCDADTIDPDCVYKCLIKNLKINKLYLEYCGISNNIHLDSQLESEYERQYILGPFTTNSPITIKEISKVFSLYQPYEDFCHLYFYLYCVAKELKNGKYFANLLYDEDYQEYKRYDYYINHHNNEIGYYINEPNYLSL